MKKGLAIILSLLMLLGAGAFAYWNLILSPNGAYNPKSAAATMEQLFESKSREDWRGILLNAWTVPVSEYESRESVFNEIFDSAASGELYFHVGEEKNSYILCTEKNDLAILRFVLENQEWCWKDTEVLLPAITGSVTIIVPEDIVPMVNGIHLPESCVSNPALPYEDMTEQEQSFRSVPCRKIYELSGLYRLPQVEAEGARLISRSGSQWSYEPEDARSNSISILAPADAEVMVCGYKLGERDVIGSESIRVDVDIPEELKSELPVYTRYRLSELYTAELNVELKCPDGTVPPCTEENGVLCFRKTSDLSPEPEIEELARYYIGDLCFYGAGKASADAPCQFVIPGSSLSNLLYRAQGSLHWIQGTRLSLSDYWVGEYLMLGEDCCVCSASVTGEVGNYYSTYVADFPVQLLCVRTANGWKVADMAYE